ncbi:MAG: NADH/ubiquinone/plastoquinone (complex I) [Gammaproteobacteria bacterium]|nr:NADH/ubiquinone/plastoquinone (complex I) [Gammaproteobacteria bacterium]
MPRLLALAPLPALAASLIAAGAPRLSIGGTPLVLLFGLDAPGALLLGVAALLWVAAGAYAAEYLRDGAHAGRFAACWLLAAAGCLGLFVAADLVSLYAMLAMMTIGAGGLVIHDGTPRAWRAAATYVGLALLAESVLLVGLVMLAAEMPGPGLAIDDAVATLAASPHRDTILALLVAGFGVKAGLVPLHVWMPLAHSAAPVPASSVLSGAVVKAGIIGLIRFLPTGEAMPAAGHLLAVAGFVTAFYGVAVGLTQRHPKAVLAYSSVSQMGVVVAVLGLGLAAGDGGAGIAAAFYAAHHVLVKGALFLAVGVAAAGAQGRRGWVLAPALLLCLGLGGLPFTGGAVAKFAVKDAFGTGVTAALSAASAAGTTMLMLHFLRRLAGAEVKDAARAPTGLLLPWLAMAAAALLLPWFLYVPAGLGTVGGATGLEATWNAFWPVALGAAFAFALRGRADHLPKVPEGDIAAALEPAAGLTLRLGAALEGLDADLRRWTVASVGLVLVAVAIGWTLWRG